MGLLETAGLYGNELGGTAQRGGRFAAAHQSCADFRMDFLVREVHRVGLSELVE